MNLALSLLTGLALASTLRAESTGKLIFSDDFNRTDLAIDKDDLGNGWTTNSELRAQGKKQAAIKDGVVVAGTGDGATHSLGLFHPAGLRDGTVEIKFQIPAGESLDLEFFDFACKTVHAGHLARVRIGPGQISITDVKTGIFDLKNMERGRADKDDAELAALLKTKTKDIRLDLKPNEWHTLRFTIRGDIATASVDRKEIGSLASPGFAHENKAQIRIDVRKAALIDDVKIWKVN